MQTDTFPFRTVFKISRRSSKNFSLHHQFHRPLLILLRNNLYVRHVPSDASVALRLVTTLTIVTPKTLFNRVFGVTIVSVVTNRRATLASDGTCRTYRLLRRRMRSGRWNWWCRLKFFELLLEILNTVLKGNVSVCIIA